MNSEHNLEPWIETFTGKKFNFLDPKPAEIDIRDIAHSLAYTCRYTGHSKRFYSVAEHSILVSYLANDPLAGLLHDASEAYITDIASPIKPYLSNYKDLEDMIMGRISAVFRFKYPLDADIKDCDATQLKTEAKHLLKSGGIPWAHKYPTKRAHGIKPMCLGPEEAEKAFLERFEEVRNDSFTRTYPWDEVPPGTWLAHSNKPLYGPEGLELRPGPTRATRVEGQDNHCGEDCQSERVGYIGLDESLSAARKATETGLPK